MKVVVVVVVLVVVVGGQKSQICWHTYLTESSGLVRESGQGADVAHITDDVWDKPLLDSHVFASVERGILVLPSQVESSAHAVE